MASGQMWAMKIVGHRHPGQDLLQLRPRGHTVYVASAAFFMMQDPNPLLARLDKYRR